MPNASKGRDPWDLHALCDRPATPELHAGWGNRVITGPDGLAETSVRAGVFGAGSELPDQTHPETSMRGKMGP